MKTACTRVADIDALTALVDEDPVCRERQRREASADGGTAIEERDTGTSTPPKSWLPKESIRSVISLRREEIRDCYERAILIHNEESGRLSMRFIIGASGAVTSAEIVQSTHDNAELESCIADRVRSWRFPCPRNGGTVTVTYPFVLRFR